MYRYAYLVGSDNKRAYISLKIQICYSDRGLRDLLNPTLFLAQEIYFPQACHVQLMRLCGFYNFFCCLYILLTE